MAQKIQKWFYNHYICPKHHYTKFTCKWSTRNVFYKLHHDKIMIMATDISNIGPGELGFLGALQNATTILLNDLSPEDQGEYTQAAVEWLLEALPPHIQSRCVQWHS
jgi:hypothetical protein